MKEVAYNMFFFLILYVYARCACFVCRSADPYRRTLRLVLFFLTALVEPVSTGCMQMKVGPRDKATATPSDFGLKLFLFYTAFPLLHLIGRVVPI